MFCVSFRSGFSESHQIKILCSEIRECVVVFCIFFYVRWTRRIFLDCGYFMPVPRLRLILMALPAEGEDSEFYGLGSIARVVCRSWQITNTLAILAIPPAAEINFIWLELWTSKRIPATFYYHFKEPFLPYCASFTYGISFHDLARDT